MADHKHFSVEDVARGMVHVLDIVGRKTTVFSAPASFGEAGPESLTFLRGDGQQAQEQISGSSAAVILCGAGAVPAGYKGSATLVVVAEPRKEFIRLVSRLFSPPHPSGIDPKAIVSPDAVIDSTAYVGPGAVVGRCTIGAHSVIRANAVLYDRVRIGQRVIIHAGTVIGADGFGYERGEDGAMEKFVHLGGVVIEDDVEIGSNTSIDRGTLGNTIIRRGTKIDNQVHIAHNVEVGEDSVLTAKSLIAGSVKIGTRVWIAPSVTILNGLTIGDDVFCGTGSVVTKSVPNGKRVMGNPARIREEA